MCDKLNGWLEHGSFYSPLEHPFPAHERPDLFTVLGSYALWTLLMKLRTMSKIGHHGVFPMFAC
jgi:hypothetical protein